MDMPNDKKELLKKNDDYLWDGSGEPDPEVQRWETLLKEFRHAGSAPEFPAIIPERRWTSLGRLWFPALAATAASLLVTGGIIFLSHNRKPLPVAGWDVSRVAGSPRIGRTTIGDKETPSRLGVGQQLETDARSTATLQAEGIGQIDMEPNTRLRLLTMAAGLKRIALDQGTIHTHIWAPPGQFVVDTPSAMTVDLGCAYTLKVDDSGNGLVHTSLGWVGFKLRDRESFIPAGAACATKRNVGPGTPYFEDASSEFRAALAGFDFEDTTASQRGADLVKILEQARKRDALTLWHLLSRVAEDQRGRVYDRLSHIEAPPAHVTKKGILRLDQSMLDQWWNALGFDDISIWRRWEHSWSEPAAPVHGK